MSGYDPTLDPDAPSNTHEFSEGEVFDGSVSDETIVVKEVGDAFIGYEYQVDNEMQSFTKKKKIHKRNAREFIQWGRWKQPLT